MSITLPPLPDPYTGLATNLKEMIRARDIEVARVVLEACKDAVTHEHLEDPQDGASDEVYDRAVRDCCDALNELEFKHD